jgi:alpha-1,2-mannosyltransferase
VGIGLAAAVKLTPLLFLGYLVVAREWRAARVAAGTFLGATVLAALVAPADSAAFWSRALWQTGRVGDLGYVSNQSLLGALTRLHATPEYRWAWPLAVLLVLAGWAVRARRAGLVGDHAAGFALTGVAACLVSPVSWVHHLVWTLPALVLTLRRALRPPRRYPLILVVAAGYLACSIGLVWLAAGVAGPAGLLGADAGVLTCLLLLSLLPVAGGTLLVHEGRDLRRHRHGRPGGAAREPARPRGDQRGHRG